MQQEGHSPKEGWVKSGFLSLLRPEPLLPLLPLHFSYSVCGARCSGSPPNTLHLRPEIPGEKHP